ncbi:MAG: hypothetical protein U5K00_15975 [Melioribacteraceae bacterium]|nr:hypothetical protein [Melioribacteraceae bacterium]
MAAILSACICIGIGEHEGIDVKTAYIAHGMVRRGDEIVAVLFCRTALSLTHG